MTALTESSLRPIADAGLRQVAPFANNGTGLTMGVSAVANNQEVSILRFDQAAIASAVGSQSVYSARLEVAISPNHSGWNGGRIAAHRMTQTWTERTSSTGVTWRCAADTNVTNSLQDCTTANRWGMNTGDVDPLRFVAQPTDTVRVYSDYTTLWLQLDVTADVQAFLSGTANHGWMLRTGTGGVTGSRISISTREDSTWAPRLILDVGPDRCPTSTKATPGQCGCDVPDTDTDQDGAADCTEPSLVPSADVGIIRSFPYDNDGLGAYLGVATTRSSTGPERALIRFDQTELAALISGNTVHEAVLELTVTLTPGGWAGAPIELRPMNRTWPEGFGWDPGAGATWDCASDPDTRLANSSSGDCTTANRWTMERDPRPYGVPTATVNVSDGDAVVRFNVTSDIRKFLTGTPNHGWIAISPESSLNPGWLYFGSRQTESPPRLRLKLGNGPGKICTVGGPATQCATGLSCKAGVGDRFGWSASTPVCWSPSCDNPQSPSFECGSTSALCGVCPVCTPDCTGRSCGSDGCWGSCGDSCDAGEAGCDSNLDCGVGLTCGMDNGPRFGRSADARVCWPELCDGLDQTSIPCGSVSDACGLCPACEPSCDGRSCGDDGCGGSCGTCGSGTTCSDALGMCLSAPLTRAFELPPEHEVETLGVGTLPGRLSVSHGGHAQYSIPIEVPPGRGGIQPELSLQYSSLRGNGTLGVGWALEGLSSITRCNKTIGIDGIALAPRFMSDDAFCLDGQRLVQDGQPVVAGSQATIRYRTEEDRFTDVSASFSVTTSGSQTLLLGPNSFTARAKDGRIFNYAVGILGSPRNGRNVFQTWPLTKVADRTGNEMVVSYVHDERPTEGGFIRDYYPQRITYGSQLAVRLFYTGDEEYPEPRKDPAPSGWRYGTRVERDRVLRRVSTMVDGSWTRHYELAYTPAPAPQSSSIASVTECVDDDSSWVCKTPTTFLYQPAVPGVQAPLEFRNATTRMSTQAINEGAGFRTLDMNGDGLDDLFFGVTVSGAVRWFVALSERGTAGAVTHNVVDTTLSGASGTPFAVLDWDNDGRQDVIEHGPIAAGQPNEYRVILFDGTAFKRYSTGIRDSVTPSFKVVLDANGDGYRDLLICEHPPTGPQWRFYAHQGGKTGTVLDAARNNRAGFTESNRRPLEVAAACPKLPVVVDKDGDGAEELIIPPLVWPYPPATTSFLEITTSGEGLTPTNAFVDAGSPFESRLDLQRAPPLVRWTSTATASPASKPARSSANARSRPPIASSRSWTDWAR